MEENNNINKAAKSAFDNFRMDPPDAAWDRIESELDRKQAVIYKRKANRFRYISLALALFLFSIIGYQLFNTTEKNNNNAESVAHSNMNEQQSVSYSEHTKPVTAEIHHHQSENNTRKNADAISKGSSSANSMDLSESTASNTLAVKDPVSGKTIKPSSIGNHFTEINKSDHETNNSKSKTHYPGGIYMDLLSSIEPHIVQDVSQGVPLVVNERDTVTMIKPYPDSKLSLGFYFTPEYKWQRLKDVSDNNLDDAAMYNGRENCMFSYSLGISLNYKLHKHWSITTGINYSKFMKDISVPVMYTKMNGENELYFEYSTAIGNIDVPVDALHSYMGPGDSLVTKSDCIQAIKSLSVPLLVRYTFDRKKFSYYLEGGIYAGYILGSKADISYDNYSPTVINNTNGMNDFCIEFSAGIGVQYHFSNSLKLFTEPVIKGSITSLSENMPVKSYPYSAGLRLGIVKDF